MNNTANKKDIFYIIVLILTFITVIVGATFAIYTFIFQQEEGTSAVYTGTLNIEYLSGEIISVGLLYPREKPTLDETHNVYKNNFKVTNTGSLDSVIEVFIDIKENQFSNKTLEYALYDEEGEEISTGYVEGRNSNSIANNIELKGYKINEDNKDYETKTYTLLIWIRDNGENQNLEMKKILTGLIRVDAQQKIE